MPSPPPSPNPKRRPKAKKADRQSPPFRILREPSPSLFPSRGEILKLLLVVFIAASVALSCSFVSGILSRRPKPFCDSGQDSQDIDICEPCPEKGWCSNGKLECLHGYKKQGRICIENGQLHQTAKKLAEVVEDDVCGSYAQVLCNRAGKIWFEEGDVAKILDDYKAREDIRIEDDNYKLAIHKALETVQGSLEKKADSNGSKEYKCPQPLAELRRPLDCCIRQWLYKHILLVTGVFTIVLCLTRFFWILHRKKIVSTRAEKLYEEVCEILEENAVRARMKNEGKPWVVASWLRDHLLLPRERKDYTLWKKVEELIQEDSRIDQYPKLIKGESKIVLEWQADGALSSRLKAKNTIKRTDKFSTQVDKLHCNQEKAKVGESLLPHL
ncbi:hypothetical protein M5K25_010165 [Dendrobium thyrsiflorum]|uniref:Man1/Src1-like C-terminal domain-containing protein n=1 Tax=Dendrobium thyrsiflorum TaxID=117978 RepID=A0ABD0V6B8_DENTH